MFIIKISPFGHAHTACGSSYTLDHDERAIVIPEKPACSLGKRKQVKKAVDGKMIAVNSVLGSRERYVDGYTASFQTNR